MAVNVVYQAPAGAYAGMGNLAGQGEFYRWLYPQQVQQNQFAVNLQHQDMTNAAQAAFQAQQADQARQFQAYQQQQQFGQQQVLQRQSQIAQLRGQEYLQNQRDQRLAENEKFRLQLQEKLATDRLNLDQKHQLNIEARRNSFEEQQQKYAENKQWQDRFYNPFAEWSKVVEQAQKAGMTYDVGVEKEAAAAQQEINNIRKSVDDEQFKFKEVEKPFRAAWSKLMQSVPTKPQVTDQERVDKKQVVWKMPDGSLVSGQLDKFGDFEPIQPPKQEKADAKFSPEIQQRAAHLESWEKRIGVRTGQLHKEWTSKSALELPGTVPPYDPVAARQQAIAENPMPPLDGLPDFMQRQYGANPAGQVPPPVQQGTPQPVVPAPQQRQDLLTMQHENMRGSDPYAKTVEFQQKMNQVAAMTDASLTEAAPPPAVVAQAIRDVMPMMMSVPKTDWPDEWLSIWQKMLAWRTAQASQ